MDPKEKELLEESVELSRENNKILKKLRSAMRVSRAFKIMYWTIIIGSMFGFYYYFQPLIDNLMGTYEGITSMFGKDSGVVSAIPDISSLLNQQK